MDGPIDVNCSKSFHTNITWFFTLNLISFLTLYFSNRILRNKIVNGQVMPEGSLTTRSRPRSPNSDEGDSPLSSPTMVDPRKLSHLAPTDLSQQQAALQAGRPNTTVYILWVFTLWLSIKFNTIFVDIFLDTWMQIYMCSLMSKQTFSTKSQLTLKFLTWHMSSFLGHASHIENLRLVEFSFGAESLFKLFWYILFLDRFHIFIMYTQQKKVPGHF